MVNLDICVGSWHALNNYQISMCSNKTEDLNLIFKHDYRNMNPKHWISIQAN